MGGGSSAASMVNSVIDNAFSATDFFDKLMENKTYYNQYHAYLQQLVDKYVNGGSFDKFYERVHSQTEAETLYQVVKLRGKSIEGQLNGTIPSTAEEQKTSDTLVDASSIDLTIMGTIMNGSAPPTPTDNDTATSSEQTDTQSANQRENTRQQPADAQTVSADDSAGKFSPADGENGKLQMGNPPGMNSDSRYSAAVRRFASAADSRAAVCSPVPQKTVQMSY